MDKMSRFESCSAAELAVQPAFIAWVKFPDTNSNAYWESFLLSYPAQKAKLLEARRLVEGMHIVSDYMDEGRAKKLWKKIEAQVDADKIPGRLARLLPRFKWVAAAVLAGILLYAGINYLRPEKANLLAEKNDADKEQPKEILPGGNHAVLTLEGGQKLVLDSLSNGIIHAEAGLSLQKQDGQLSYSVEDPGLPVSYNKIETPRGGQYQLVLSDGTRVWLNAASSLRFPTTFAGNERKVELTGEGYFEVAHNAAQPFLVEANGTTVQVLGTHFNVNAYADEEAITTTLLEGRVKILRQSNFLFLNPGQQGVSNKSSSEIQVRNNVDIDGVVAWKDGLFNFEHSDINRILRDFARWYNIDIEVRGKVNADEKYFGIVSRNTPLDAVINVLNVGSKGKIKYRIEGKKLIVIPENQ
ncbi:MAG TPA: FecR domain-containing protein [Chitinophagaceae bacterium]|nr:FecR domain-containing protein [Chitinophagaceae bacterium]